MVSILKIDHIGIRVKEKKRATDFYEKLGFELIVDTGFEKGHPIMMQHACGIVLNLLGPSTVKEDENILMDIDQKHAGYTHMALKIESLVVPTLLNEPSEKPRSPTGRPSGNAKRL